MGVRVISLRRQTGKTELPTDALLLQDGDTLVLSGEAAPLALAEEKFLKG
jgi:CPA2 family monovalent cation:H+ antiporter-2